MKPNTLIKAASLLCASVLAAGCTSEASNQEGPRSRPVKIVEVKQSSDVRDFTFPTIVEASESVNLSFQVSGMIEAVYVIDGQAVSKGDVIARLDQRDFKNNLAQADAEFRNAEIEAQRGEKLVAQGALAQSALDQRLARRDIALANLDTARKAKEDTVLRSPFDGVVSRVEIDPFQNIAAQTPAVTLQTDGTVHAVVDIPATLIANVDRIEVLENSVILDVAPDESLPLELFEISRRADPSTQTFEVKFAFTPPDRLNVLPGMTGNIYAKLGYADPATSNTRIELPSAAVVARNGKTFVWTVDMTDMSITLREVTTATSFAESLRVIDGLQPGDHVVAAGAAFLHEGMKVQPWTP